VMIWLSIVSMAAGALVAYRFKITALMPATIVVILIAATGAGLGQTKSLWSILLIISATSFSMQAGYFIGMMVQYLYDKLSARRRPAFCGRTSVGDAVR
jgi:4-hydroxybenzoate polyprenyltransferase